MYSILAKTKLIHSTTGTVYPAVASMAQLSTVTICTYYIVIILPGLSTSSPRTQNHKTKRRSRSRSVRVGGTAQVDLTRATSPSLHHRSLSLRLHSNQSSNHLCSTNSNFHTLPIPSQYPPPPAGFSSTRPITSFPINILLNSTLTCPSPS